MENNSVLNEENLVDEIKLLKSEIATANDKLQPILENIKLEEHNKNFHRAQIEKLKNDVDYYSKLVLKIEDRLSRSTEINWQFNAADQYYERIMKDIEDIYAEVHNNLELEDKNIAIRNQLLDDNEIEKLHIKIDRNNSFIESVLADLEQLE